MSLFLRFDPSDMFSFTYFLNLHSSRSFHVCIHCCYIIFYLFHSFVFLLLLYQMFKYKIKVSDAHRAWMKNPEDLKHCSTGFGFPSQSGETVQVVRCLFEIICIYIYIFQMITKIRNIKPCFQLSWL